MTTKVAIFVKIRGGGGGESIGNNMQKGKINHHC